MSEENAVQFHSSKPPTRARRQGQRLTQEERQQAQEVFLASFQKYANLSVACNEAGIDLSTPYKWKKRYPAFAEKFAEAEQRSNDSIDMEIYRRAIEGWKEPMVSAGQYVCDVTKYSDSMLTLLAKSRMKKYREKQPDVDVTVQINTLAEQAKSELLADLATAMTDEDQDQAH